MRDAANKLSLVRGIRLVDAQELRCAALDAQGLRVSEIVGIQQSSVMMMI